MCHKKQKSRVTHLAFLQSFTTFIFSFSPVIFMIASLWPQVIIRYIDFIDVQPSPRIEHHTSIHFNKPHKYSLCAWVWILNCFYPIWMRFYLFLTLKTIEAPWRLFFVCLFVCFEHLLCVLGELLWQKNTNLMSVCCRCEQKDVEWPILNVLLDARRSQTIFNLINSSQHVN